jgi:hypothetical protein
MWRIWSVAKRQQPASYLEEGSLQGLASSADGEYLITRSGIPAASSQELKEVAVWTPLVISEPELIEKFEAIPFDMPDTP